MATKTFNLSWMRQYRADTNSYVGSNSPIRVGGSQDYNSYLGFPTSVRTAIKESSTTPQLRLKIYVTNSSPEWDVGRHKLSGSSEPTYSTLPWYNYLKPIFGHSTGWLTINLSSDFMNDYKNGVYQGIVLYSGQGSSYYGEASNSGSTRAVIEVIGTWNVKPNKPTITYPTSNVTVDTSLTVRWNQASDPNGDTLKYQVAYKGGRSGEGWKYSSLTANNATALTINYSSLSEGTYAQIAVRAYDGELYGDWVYSPRFTVNHNKAPSSPSQLSPANGVIRDRNEVIRLSWRHNDDGSQAGYRIAWRTVSSTGARGAWNYRPSSTGWVSSTSQYYDYPATTFPNSEIEWTVKTKDQGGLESSYATYQIFKAREESSLPTILTPAFNDIIDTTRVEVTWSSVNQQEYNLILKDDQGNTLWSTTEVNGLKFVIIPYDLANNTNYSIQLRVKDSVNLIWSDYVEQAFSTSFNPPKPPVILGSEEISKGVTNIIYSTTDENIAPKFILGEGQVNPILLPYGSTVIGTDVEVVGQNDLSMTGQLMGIEFIYSDSELDLSAGQYYKLSADFKAQGGRLVISAYNETDVLLTSDSTSSVLSSSPLGYASVDLVLPNDTKYIKLSIYTTSDNTNVVVANACRLNQLSVVTNDYYGKVSGSNTAIPHIALANGVATTLVEPDGIWGEFVTDSADNYSYERIGLLDARISKTQSWALGGIGQEAFGFNLIEMIERAYGTIPNTFDTLSKVNWLRDNIKVVRFTTVANGYGQVGSTPYADGYTSGVWNGFSWEDTNTHTAGTPLKSSVEVLSDSLSNGSYIDEQGFIYFHHYAPPASNDSPSIVETDYVKVEFEWFELGGGYDGVVASTIDVLRREYTPTGEKSWITVGQDLSPKGSFIDYTPASGVTYEYKLKAYANNSTSTESVPYINTTVFDSTMLQRVSDMSNVNELLYVDSRDSKMSIKSESRLFAGRKKPVTEFGEVTERSLDVTWEVDTFDEVLRFIELIEERDIMLYRDFNGRKMWVTAHELTVEDKEVNGFVLSAVFTEVDYKEDLNEQEEELI